MLATKMRALFQRKKGRDLFDLYWALSVRSALPVSVAEILRAFDHYMKAEGELTGRSRIRCADPVAVPVIVDDSGGFGLVLKSTRGMYLDGPRSTGCGVLY
jgi:Nucleotidyl transferase AbiEii toxin, Type IV TA system